jgi:pimeloyl-ACP methyl ester carboxylesterase
MAGLLSHRREVSKFRYGIALFAGHPGILRLREEAGQAAFDLRGNFLVRSRQHWLDEETLVIVVDAPSDQWSSFSQHFRETKRYGEDVAALLRAAGERFGVTDWTAVGTSEGSVSAFHAARMHPEVISRLILSASVFLPSRNGPGLSWVAWDELKMPLLWVHHVADPCKFTPYRSAEDFAAKTKAPLITVRGTDGWSGNACNAFTGHGFAGVEAETVQAMRAWMKTGVAVNEVGR